MAKRSAAPAFLVLAPDGRARASWKERLQRHGQVRMCADIDAVSKELQSLRRRWLCFVVDVEVDRVSIHRALKSMRRAEPMAPGVVIVREKARAPKALAGLGFRVVVAPVAPKDVRSFIGYSLALEVSQNPHIAAAVEAIGAQKALTVKQMELTALAATDLTREELVAGLGVSHNTVKTRVRQLLRIHEEDSMDSLGKTVLRLALAHATHPSWTAPSRGIVPPPKGPGAMPAQRKAQKRARPPRAT